MMMRKGRPFGGGLLRLGGELRVLLAAMFCLCGGAEGLARAMALAQWRAAR